MPGKEKILAATHAYTHTHVRHICSSGGKKAPRELTARGGKRVQHRALRFELCFSARRRVFRATQQQAAARFFPVGSCRCSAALFSISRERRGKGSGPERGGFILYARRKARKIEQDGAAAGCRENTTETHGDRSWW